MSIRGSSEEKEPKAAPVFWIREILPGEQELYSKNHIDLYHFFRYKIQ